VSSTEINIDQQTIPIQHVNSSELPADSIMGLAAAGLAIHFVSYMIYNLFWHPLASFPGPFAAAVTPLYKAYIDLVTKSSLVHTLRSYIPSTVSKKLRPRIPS
jgi:hypothetical protein